MTANKLLALHVGDEVAAVPPTGRPRIGQITSIHGHQLGVSGLEDRPVYFNRETGARMDGSPRLILQPVTDDMHAEVAEFEARICKRGSR